MNNSSEIYTEQLGFNHKTGISTELKISPNAARGRMIAKTYDQEKYLAHNTAEGAGDANRRQMILQSTLPGLEVAKEIANNSGVAASEIFRQYSQLEYKTFLGILVECGISAPSQAQSFSIYQLLHDDQDNIDLEKVRRLYRSLLEKTEVLKSDTPALLHSHGFDLIIEALAGILLKYSNNTNINATPGILDIRIGPDLKVEFFQEYIDGENLHNKILRMQQSNNTGEQLDLMQEILGAILDSAAVIDSSQVIHGDVKPQNIQVDQQGHGKLIDFGFAIISDKKLHSQVYRGDISGNMQPTSLDNDSVSQDVRGKQEMSTPQYRTYVNSPGIPLKDSIQTDSFAYTLTVLDAIDFMPISKEKRGYSESKLASMDERLVGRFVDKYMQKIEEYYNKYLWDRSVTEKSRNIFYNAIRTLLLVGTNNSDMSKKITLSARLIPMYMYALFLCVEGGQASDKIFDISRLRMPDLNPKGWTIDPIKLADISEIIQLATKDTTEFSNNPEDISRYGQIASREPMAGAIRRSLGFK